MRSSRYINPNRTRQRYTICTSTHFMSHGILLLDITISNSSTSNRATEILEGTNLQGTAVLYIGWHLYWRTIEQTFPLDKGLFYVYITYTSIHVHAILKKYDTVVPHSHGHIRTIRSKVIESHKCFLPYGSL